MAELSGPEWFIEQGIGETRRLLIENGEVLAAKLHWPGELLAGEIVDAQLVSKPADARRGTAVLDNGREVLVDHLPRGITEGERVQLCISRSVIAERGRFKRAQGRFVEQAEAKSAPSPFGGGTAVRSFPTGLWEDIWSAASSASVEFPSGNIVISVTPAMTVIDIDGGPSPRELALSAVPSIAQAVSWFNLGGNIGIDFPTLQAKLDRRAVDEALGAALDRWPHERTAMNGFGFVQIVARLEGPSLLHRFATSRVGMCARYALRVAERVEGAGMTLLTVHPALKAKLKPEWLDDLRRRTGREVRIETDSGLALEAPHAQIVSA